MHSHMSLNILLIEDDAQTAKTIQDALASSGDGPFAVEWVRSCAEGLQRLSAESAEGETAVVLIDLFLPDSKGCETFDRLYLATPSIPILVLIGGEEEELGRIAVRRGAQDYLLKDHLDPYLLPKALRSMVERAMNAEALFEEQERARVTLNSIGDAVMTTDVSCRVTYLNAVAEELTGWTRKSATGRPIKEVFRIIDSNTREVARNPMAAAIRDDKTVALTPNCVLVRKDGFEAAIEDSAAPIHDRRGRVTGSVIAFHDVSSARTLANKMSYLAQHDSLTDLPNRVLLNDRLSQAMTMARRHGHQLGVLFLDLDHFKGINDSFGHDAGDLVLQAVAKRLPKCLRSSDTISRQGGDEFLIILAELARGQDAAVSAGKLLRALQEPLPGPHNLSVSGSIGVAIYPDDGMDAETLIKHADLAMYQAKKSGRNTYQFFQADLSAGAVERQSLEKDLRVALERKELVLLYQPKLDLETGAINGVEALLRWRHPTRGLLLPAEFIHIAEECGLIVPIGRWVLREACRQAQAWRGAEHSQLRIAINVSPVELREKSFEADLRASLQATGVDPGCVELELTETFLMQDEKATAVVLQSLKDTGVQIALDDFGTGYSSLSHLKRFPFDILKIDQSFVRDIATNADDASIVSAMISMGKNLRVRVVAEGVETPEQLAFLRKECCPEGQGFYFSRPVTADGFQRLAANPVGSLLAAAPMGARVEKNGVRRLA